MNWDELQADFQGAGEPLRPEELRRFRSRQRMKVGVELLAGAVIVAFYVRVLSRAPTPPLIALAVISLIFTGGYMVYLFANRNGLLRASATDTASWRALLRKRVDADLRWNRFLTRFCVGAAAFGLIWGPWMVIQHAAIYRAEPWRAVLGFGVYYAVLLGLWFGQRRARRRLLEEGARMEGE